MPDCNWRPEKAPEGGTRIVTTIDIVSPERIDALERRIAALERHEPDLVAEQFLQAQRIDGFADGMAGAVRREMIRASLTRRAM
jgi:hypothetical protein